MPCARHNRAQQDQEGKEWIAARDEPLH